VSDHDDEEDDVRNGEPIAEHGRNRAGDELGERHPSIYFQREILFSGTTFRVRVDRGDDE
jgi:hypothetical protein